MDKERNTFMYLDEAQAIVRGRTACVGLSLQSLTASMADLDLYWMARGTERGVQIRIFTAHAHGDEQWQLEYVSRDYHMTHALTYALAEWFVIQSRDERPFVILRFR
ncbi:hypothetical protein [Deinococcus altitudinis]|uniref:hypothetical protein n=1 Tax=Deinococcus altitudinis TaxID=468914 RepID=UPI0038929D8F